jgi:Transcription factor WhiB
MTQSPAITVPESAAHRPVTELSAAELDHRVLGASPRPCALPGANPDDWFPPEPGSGNHVRSKSRARYEARARALCRFCPAGVECLELAIRREGPQRGHGIYGGTAPWQRQAIKASRGLPVNRD